MEPTLKPGDRLLTVRIRRHDQLKRQDLVVFYSREYKKVMIKRVIGLPDDLVTIKPNGEVHINGEMLQEPYVTAAAGPSGTHVVPSDHYMLLGDHRTHSTDSRFWRNPFIREHELLGRVVFRFYPFRQSRRFVSNPDKRSVIHDTQSQR
ncbi:MAG: signal peptidase I [Bacillota bacterium]|nr:signal peptidase I [Bacillota bacterium]